MSTRIKYGRFARVLDRSEEVASEADVKKIVKMVFDDLLKQVMAEFMAAHKAVVAAEGAWAKENAEGLAALGELNQPFQEVRAVMEAYLPHAVLPAPLKSQPTDTDRMRAIGDLVDLLDLNQGETWAASLLTGEFGTKAPQTVTELEESIAANKAYAAARDERAAAYGPAYEQYLAFKKVVRAAYGPTSKQYKRIHIAGGKGGDPVEPVPQPTPPAS